MRQQTCIRTSADTPVFHAAKRRHGWIALLATAALATVLASNPIRSAADVPNELVPPSGSVEVVRWYGVGTQNYVSVPRADDPTKFTWKLRAPSARLLNRSGKVMGTHYAGPIWESNNGSKVQGLRIASANSPDPNAIPWLLLQGVWHEGRGVFGAVSYIQRLDTNGGQPPAEAPTAAGLEVSVAYSATYVFFETDEE